MPVAALSTGRTTATEVEPVRPKTAQMTAASTGSSRHDGRSCVVHRQNRERQDVDVEKAARPCRLVATRAQRKNMLPLASVCPLQEGRVRPRWSREGRMKRERVPPSAWRDASGERPVRLKTFERWLEPAPLERLLRERSLGRRSGTSVRRTVEGWFLLSTELVEDCTTVTKTGLTCCDIDKSGRFALAGGTDGRARLFDLERRLAANRPLRCGGSLAVCAASWYPADGGLFATACRDGTIGLWDARRLQRVRSWRLASIADGKAGGAFGLVAAACGDGALRLCDPRSPRPTELAKLATAASAVAWARHSEHALCAAWGDRTCRLLDDRKGPVAVLNRHGTANWGRAHDSTVVGIQYASRSVLTVAADGDAAMWDASSGAREPVHLPRFASPRPPLGMAAADPAEPHRALAFVPSDGAVLGVDLVNGSCDVACRAPGRVTACSLRPCRPQLLVVDDQGHVSLCQVLRKSRLDEGESGSRSNLDAAESGLDELRRAVLRARRDARERRIREEED